MTGEKSSAQLKNEAEVKRILAERGYSSPEHKKKVKKSLGRGFSFKPFIIGIIVIGLAVGGWFFLQNNPFNKNQNSDQFEEYTPEGSEQELAGFYSCLDLVDTSEIALDDAEFWNKHISRYEQTIACYDQYPSVSSSSEKTDLETKLSELRENSQKAEANDIEYRSSMAQIDAELSQNLARIKAEGDAWDAELSQRVQQRQAESDARQAEYEKQQAEYNEKQARCNAFKAEYSSADDYREKNGNITELYNKWQSAQSAYYKAADAYTSALANNRGNASSISSSSVDRKRAEMDAAHDAWFSTYTRLGDEYNAKYREACL